MHAIDNYGQGFTLNKAELSDLEPDVILESKTLDFSSDDTLVRNIWFFFSSRSLKTREKYISFAQLVWLGWYIFWGKCVCFSILEW